MTILALAPWVGSKRTLATTIIEQLGEHQLYFEPFVGSMAVFLAKRRVAQEQVNDLHGELLNLAYVVQSERLWRELHARAESTPFHEGLLNVARERVAITEDQPANPDAPDLERAYQFLIFSWFPLSGIAGTALSNTRSFRKRYTEGGNGVTHWQSVAGSIPYWHRRLLEVVITQRDGFDELAKIKDDSSAALYVDPPYFKKGFEYKHDFKPEDHERLAELLNRFKHARIVLSYYDHPLLWKFYPDWQRLEPAELGVSKAMVQSGKRDRRGKVESPEVLLVNGPLFERQWELF